MVVPELRSEVLCIFEQDSPGGIQKAHVGQVDEGRGLRWNKSCQGAT